jgi:hypothetical protein
MAGSRLPSRLKMNSLRSALTATAASHESPDIRAKENIRYELTQPQNGLTPTGLLMEAQCTFPGVFWPRNATRRFGVR